MSAEQAFKDFAAAARILDMLQVQLGELQGAAKTLGLHQLSGDMGYLNSKIEEAVRLVRDGTSIMSDELYQQARRGSMNMLATALAVSQAVSENEEPPHDS